MASKSRMAVVAAGMVAGLAYGYGSTPVVDPELQARTILAAVEQVSARSPADGAERPVASCAGTDEP